MKTYLLILVKENNRDFRWPEWALATPHKGKYIVREHHQIQSKDILLKATYMLHCIALHLGPTLPPI